MVGSRIRIIREENNYTQKEFAKKFNISYGTLQSYEYGETEPKLTFLKNLSKHFKLPMSFFYDENGSIPINSTQPNLVKLNYYPSVSVSAGYGAINYDETSKTVEISRSFLEALGLKALKNLDLVSVFGDSMEPFVSNGEMVIVERTHEAKNNDIVIANINGEVYVKKLQRSPFGNVVKLVSTNQMYMDIELKDDELEYLNIIGVVRAKIRPF